MDLIDWAGVARNALWIAGLSVAFASCSYASWYASRNRIRFRQAMALPAFQAALAAGLLLVCAGLAWSATRLWERAAWVVLASAFVWQLVAAARALRGSRQHSDGG